MSHRRIHRGRRAVASLVVLIVAISGAFIGSSHPASAELPRDAAVEWAKAQIGKPYAWGGTGPDSFDCSGLVQEAWASAGVQLPRMASDQSRAGERIPLSEVRTGDIVSWGTDPNDPSSVYHVAIYANDGIVVVAPNRGGTVKLDHMNSTAYGLMPYATRVVD